MRELVDDDASCRAKSAEGHFAFWGLQASTELRDRPWADTRVNTKLDQECSQAFRLSVLDLKRQHRAPG